MKSTLERLFAEILAEAKTNRAFGERIARALGASSGSGDTHEGRANTRPRNRRDRAVVDPYNEFAQGEEHARKKLAALTVEQLKDIVSEHAMDSSRLALKWKSSERLVELILDTVRGRMEKGDVFRS